MKLLHKMNQLFNTCLIEKNPVIVGEMMRHNRRYGRINDRRARAGLVLGLFLKYGVLHRDPLQEFERQTSSISFPESGDCGQIPHEEIRKKTESVETVVFDAWGVLLVMGLETYQLRAMAECELLALGSAEREEGGAWEQERYRSVAEDFVIDNPFMHAVWDALQAEGKKLLICNNSGCDDRFVEAVLRRHGYQGELTCDSGALCHITNDAKSDRDIVYQEVNQAGGRYRTCYEYNAVTNLADRIVNLLLHGDGRKKSPFYEYGVVCGGILTCGFCHWLNELADRKKTDLFLFVARDGAILQKIYREHYGIHASAYLLFSRFASFELIFEDHPQEYIEKNIRPRLDRRGCDNSMAGILKECGLEFLLCRLPEGGMAESDILCQDNYGQFKDWLLRYHKQITEHFHESCVAAEQYYRKVCRGHRNICVVDLGWHGKSIVYLKYFMERKCAMDVCVTGAMIGACDDVVTQNYIRKGLIDTYAFESDRWRSQGSRNGTKMGYRETICTEALFSSSADTLLRYGLGEERQTVFYYGKKNENAETVREIHRGIEDFAGIFARIQKRYGLRVTPRDAYTPLSCKMKDRRFLNWLYEHYREETGALNGFGQQDV